MKYKISDLLDNYEFSDYVEPSDEIDTDAICRRVHEKLNNNNVNSSDELAEEAIMEKNKNDIFSYYVENGNKTSVYDDATEQNSKDFSKDITSSNSNSKAKIKFISVKTIAAAAAALIMVVGVGSAVYFNSNDDSTKVKTYSSSKLENNSDTKLVYDAVTDFSKLLIVNGYYLKNVDKLYVDTSKTVELNSFVFDNDETTFNSQLSLYVSSWLSKNNHDISNFALSVQMGYDGFPVAVTCYADVDKSGYQKADTYTDEERKAKLETTNSDVTTPVTTKKEAVTTTTKVTVSKKKFNK